MSGIALQYLTRKIDPSPVAVHVAGAGHQTRGLYFPAELLQQILVQTDRLLDKERLSVPDGGPLGLAVGERRQQDVEAIDVPGGGELVRGFVNVGAGMGR